MSKTKTKYSVTKAVKGSSVWYLSTTDEEKGKDIELDLLRYTLIAL